MTTVDNAIVDVVGRHVKLVPKGHRFLGLCPFQTHFSPGARLAALRQQVAEEYAQVRATLPVEALA